MWHVVLGAAITWVVAYVFYVRAGDKLRAEAERSRKLINLILSVLEKNGRATLTRDSDGNILDFTLLEAAVHDKIAVGDAATAQVVDRIHEEESVSCPEEVTRPPLDEEEIEAQAQINQDAADQGERESVKEAAKKHSPKKRKKSKKSKKKAVTKKPSSKAASRRTSQPRRKRKQKGTDTSSQKKRKTRYRYS
jgi:outer membrane biosynthesis protein TonB